MPPKENMVQKIGSHGRPQGMLEEVRRVQSQNKPSAKPTLIGRIIFHHIASRQKALFTLRDQVLASLEIGHPKQQPPPERIFEAALVHVQRRLSQVGV